MKKTKRFFSILLSMLMLVSLMPTAFADDATNTVEKTENEETISSVIGDGTKDSPYLISTEEELLAVANDLRAYYELQNDITLTSDWTPMGTFSGSFNGNGYTISGINIPDVRNYTGTGFFETNQGTIKNLTVHTTIYTSNAWGYYGGLAANNSGIITNCHAVVDMNISCSCDINHPMRVGGLVASNDGGTIKNCSVTESSIITSGTGKFAAPNTGGIAGWNFYDGTISSCYFSGTVSGDMTGGITGWNYELIERCHSDGSITNSDDAGGITGHNSGDIKECYSICCVQGESYAGGLVGLERGGSIYHCYAVGYVESSSKAGALTGNSSDKENTTSSYYNSEACGCETGGVAIPLTTKEMQTITSYENWDFENVWDISPNVNNGYPYLREPSMEEDNENDESGEGSDENNIKVVFENVKTEYYVGEEFYAEVYVYTADGNYYQAEAYEIEGFDSYMPGWQTVTLKYVCEDDITYTETYEVVVYENDVPRPEPAEVVFENVKTEYFVGEEFYAEVYVYTDDGNRYQVEVYEIEGFDNTMPGWQTVTLRYGQSSVSYKVLVYETDEPDPEPTEEVVIENVKTKYYVGEEFYAEVYVYTAEGDCYKVEDFEVEGFDSKTAGRQKVTVRYNNYSETFTVMVSEQEIVEPENAAKITIGDIKTLPGKEIQVTIDLSDNMGFADLGIEIGYDSDIMTLTNVTANQNVGATFTPAETYTVNPYNMGWKSNYNTTYNGNLATLTFLINENAPDGVYPITVDYYKGRNGNYIDGNNVNYDENFEAVKFVYISGDVTVRSYIPGDINGDEIIDNKDGTYILRYLAGWNIPDVVEEAVDVNGDGFNDNKDATILLRYLAGWDITLQ